MKRVERNDVREPLPSGREHRVEDIANKRSTVSRGISAFSTLRWKSVRHNEIEYYENCKCPPGCRALADNL